MLLLRDIFISPLFTTKETNRSGQTGTVGYKYDVIHNRVSSFTDKMQQNKFSLYVAGAKLSGDVETESMKNSVFGCFQMVIQYKMIAIGEIVEVK